MVTQEYIDRVVQRLGRDGELVTKLWSECVPVNEYLVEDKLPYIIASLPGVVKMSPQFACMQLTIGPEFVQDWGIQLKPEVIHVWAEEYPKTAIDVAETYRKAHTLPDSVSRSVEWACMQAIREEVRILQVNGADVSTIPHEVEGLQSTALMWLYEMQKEENKS